MIDSDPRRIGRAAAADVRAARRRIAASRQFLQRADLAPGARQFVQESIEAEARYIARTIANARAAASAVPAQSSVDLREQVEADGTLDRLVAQFRDDERQIDRLTNLAKALTAAPLPQPQ
jgi:hypothetical protein